MNLLRSPIRIARESWYYLMLVALVFVGSVARDVNLLLVLSGLLLFPFLLSFRAVWKSIDRLEVERRMPHELHAGEPFVVGVGLDGKQRRRGSLGVVVEDRIHRVGGRRRANPDGRPRVFFPYIPAGRRRETTYQGVIPLRGLYQIGPLQVSSRFPFGLVERVTTVDRTAEVLVYPRVGRVTSLWTRRHREALTGETSRRNRAGAEGDFHGMRQWRHGDRRRQINWAGYAKTGRLTVRQYERPSGHDLALILDLHVELDADPADRQRAELIVSFAATLVADACRRGTGRLILGTCNSGDENGNGRNDVGDDNQRIVDGPVSTSLLQESLRRLALVGYNSGADADARLDQLLDSLLRRVDGTVEVVLLSTREVDLTEPSRFPIAATDLQLRKLTRSIRRINAQTEDLSQYFVYEEAAE